MNSKLKIILIIGIALLLGGIGVGTAGFAMGGMKAVAIQASGLQVIDESHEAQIAKVDETFENVAAINVSLDSIESVRVKEGPALTVRGQQFIPFGGLAAARAEDGTLAVTHSVKRTLPYGIIDFPSVFRAAINSHSSSYLEITVPQGTSLAAITIDLDLGGVEIDSAVAERMDIKVDAGKISASNLTCESFSIDSDFGDVDVQNVNANDVVVTGDSGNMKLWNLTAPGSLTLTSSFGSVDLEAVNAGTSDVDLSSGDFSARGMSVADGMKLNVDFGSIKFTGSLRGDKNIITSASGDTDLALNGRQDDYAISVESNAGEVRLGDRGFTDYVHGRVESGPSSAPNKVEIISNFGNVDVTFRG
ncbi:MAG: DUF4097 domain-containing protein [Clostridiales Family XIII bacterium]|jgi:hypothetical protein|nr:DUF4097 domain-containing protein [Clostridiales Family XIII bacterium]